MITDVRDERSKIAGILGGLLLTVVLVLVAAQEVGAQAPAFTFKTPTIMGISPAGGPAGSTVDATITGTNLAGAAVKVKGSGVTVTVLPGGTATSLLIRLTIAPNAPVGQQVTIFVSTPVAPASAVTSFSIQASAARAPAANAPVPAAAPTIGRVERTADGYMLLGSGFGTDRGAIKVFEGDAEVTDRVTWVAPTVIAVRSRPAGTVKHKVVVGQQSSELTATHAAAAARPVIGRIEPPEAALGSTVTVKVTGEHLTGARVRVGGPSVPGVSQVGPVTVAPDGRSLETGVRVGPDALPGPVLFEVTTDGGTTAKPFTVASAARAPAAKAPVPAAARPTITRVDPNRGPQGATIDVTITGTNLAGARVAVGVRGVTATVRPGGTATSLPIRVSVAPDALPGPVALEITTPGGTSATPFSVVQEPSAPAAAATPKVSIGPGLVREGAIAQISRTEIKPNSGRRRENIVTTFASTGTGADLTRVAVPISVGVRVSGAGVSAALGGAPTPTSLPLLLSIAHDAPLGERIVTVTMTDGQTLTAPFTVVPADAIPPRISHLDTNAPYVDSGEANNTEVDVLIVGERLSGTVSVDGEGVTVTWTYPVPEGSWRPDWAVRLRIAENAPAGPRTLRVTNRYGMTSTTTFTVHGPRPVVTGMTPRSIVPGAQVTHVEVTLTGRNLMTPTRPGVSGPPGVKVVGVLPGGSPTSQSLRLRVEPIASFVGPSAFDHVEDAGPSVVTSRKLWVTFRHSGAGDIREYFPLKVVPPPPTITGVSSSSPMRYGTRVDVTVTGTSLIGVSRGSLSGGGETHVGEVEVLRGGTATTLPLRLKIGTFYGSALLGVHAAGGYTDTSVNVVPLPPRILGVRGFRAREGDAYVLQAGETVNVDLSTQWTKRATVSLSVPPAQGMAAAWVVADYEYQLSFKIFSHALMPSPGRHTVRVTTAGGTAEIPVLVRESERRRVLFEGKCDPRGGILKALEAVALGGAATLATGGVVPMVTPGDAGYQDYFAGVSLQNGWVVESVKFTPSCNANPGQVTLDVDPVALFFDGVNIVTRSPHPVMIAVNIVDHILRVNTGIGAYVTERPATGSPNTQVKVRWWVNPEPTLLPVLKNKDTGYRGEVTVRGPGHLSCGLLICLP